MQSPMSNRYAVLGLAHVAKVPAEAITDLEEEEAMISQPSAEEVSRIPSRWRWGFVPVLAAIVGLAVLYRPSTFSRSRKGRLGMDLQGKEEWPCGKVEENIDYWTSQPLFSLLDVDSPEDCRDQCQSHSHCYTWTWGASHGIRGAWHAYHTCFLKAKSCGSVKRYTEDGVVSGIACREGAGAAAGASIDAGSSAGPAASGAGSYPTPAPPPTPPPPSSDPLAGQVIDPALAAYAEEPSGNTYMNMPIQGGDLFCWALMLPHSNEPILLAMQYAERQSLFGCDQAAVYSNKTMQIGPDFISIAAHVNLECKFGGEFKTALNKDIFDTVWRKIVDDGVFKFYAWTVKVDPDAVFFPGRLKFLLPKYTPGDKGMYLNNCPRRGLHGPLEVLSSKAVEIYVGYEDQCNTHFEKLCSGDCHWGEDMFMDQCLMKVLGVDRQNESNLLVEDHCDPPPHWKDCKSDKDVAFHPFKTTETYQTCLEASASYAGYPIHPAYVKAARDAAAQEEGRLRAIRAAELLPPSIAPAAYPAPVPGYPGPAPEPGTSPAAVAYPSAYSTPAPYAAYPAPAPGM